tara:strand:- start:1063 stop:1665 length:603 start_codon:yes stop_codon:yes gene_type:complete
MVQTQHMENKRYKKFQKGSEMKHSNHLNRLGAHKMNKIFPVLPFALASMVSLHVAADNTHVYNSQNRVEQFIENSRISSPANVSIIEQIGNDNSAEVSQSRSSRYQANNLAYIYQNGNRNNGAIHQLSGNNVGFILQFGNDHNAIIEQRSHGRGINHSSVVQTGFNSDITLSQSGSGYRSITVEQQAFSGNARPVTVETY